LQEKKTTKIDIKMNIISISKQIDDYRIDRKKEHSVEVILYIAFAAVICGAESWYDIQEFGRAKESFFRSRIPSFKSVPSHDTFNRFFSALNPEYFEKVFRNWMLETCTKYKGVVAIDGKTLRGASKCTGTNPNGSSISKLHMVSAWAASNGVTLGQMKTNNKSNEITAIPKLIKALDLSQCIITIDAMGCQKKIAKTIIKGKGDYVLHVKDNQKNLHNELIKWFDSMDQIGVDVNKPYYSNRYAKFCSENSKHGRIEKRECMIYSQPTLMEKMLKGWKGIKTVVRLKSTRTIVTTAKTSTENRYYISSIGLDAKKIANAIRTHWSIENNLHWQLDVSFGEDADKKTANAAQNFSLINKLALMTLKKDQKKASIKGKRKAAGWNEEYLCQLLSQDSF
jgi:predicted transposase YbfD/YdcC